MRGRVPCSVSVSALVLSRPQQAMRASACSSMLMVGFAFSLSGKVSFASSAALFWPTTIFSLYSSASWSRYSIISGIL